MSRQRKRYRQGPSETASEKSRRQFLWATTASVAGISVASALFSTFQSGQDEEQDSQEVSQRTKEVNAMAQRMQKHKPPRTRNVDIHLHPHAQQLVTVIRMKHLDVLMGRPELPEETLKIQDDIEVIVGDLHDRFNLNMIVAEGVDEFGNDSCYDAFVEDITVLDALGIKDDATFALLVSVSEHEAKDVIGGNAQMKERFDRIRREVEEAGSFAQWKKNLMEYAKKTSTKYSGVRRAAEAGKVNLLPGEKLATQLELLRAAERGDREEVDRLTFDVREDNALNTAVESKEKHCGIAYGAMHTWKNNTNKRNKAHPHQAISLAVVSPTALPKDITQKR